MAVDCDRLSQEARKLFEKIKPYFKNDPSNNARWTEDGQICDNGTWYDLRKCKVRNFLIQKQRRLIGFIVELNAFSYRKENGSLDGFPTLNCSRIMQYNAEILLLYEDIDFQIETLDFIDEDIKEDIKVEKMEGGVISEMVTKKVWSNPTILVTLPNPSTRGYEIKTKSFEITFMGVSNQPDFASAYITFYPNKSVIELKSLKIYFQQFRDKIISYERLVNVIYDDLISVYEPARLRLVMILSPRGGISSKLTIDSDWHVRGGEEKFRDWIGQSDEW